MTLQSRGDVSDVSTFTLTKMLNKLKLKHFYTFLLMILLSETRRSSGNMCPNNIVDV